MCPSDLLIEFVLLIHSSLESFGIELQILKGEMFPLGDTIRFLLNWTLTTILFVESSIYSQTDRISKTNQYAMGTRRNVSVIKRALLASHAASMPGKNCEQIMGATTTS